GQQRGRRGGEERRVVVLADRENVQPDLFGLLRDLGDRIDPFGLAGRVARHRVAGDVTDREDPELHGACLRYMRLHLVEQAEAAGYSGTFFMIMDDLVRLAVPDHSRSRRSRIRGGLMELSRVQAVLLDMDGTLVDSDAAVERSWRTWAAEYRVAPGREPLVAHGLPALGNIRRLRPD